MVPSSFYARFLYGFPYRFQRAWTFLWSTRHLQDLVWLGAWNSLQLTLPSQAALSHHYTANTSLSLPLTDSTADTTSTTNTVTPPLCLLLTHSTIDIITADTPQLISCPQLTLYPLHNWHHHHNWYLHLTLHLTTSTPLSLPLPHPKADITLVTNTGTPLHH